MKSLTIILVLSVLILSGCSQNSKYEELMSNAEKAIDDLEVNKALSYYDKALKLNPNKLDYGEGRLYIAQTLRDKTEQLQNQINRINSEAQEVLSFLNEETLAKKNFNELSNVYSTLSNLLSELENYPNTTMYKDLNKAQQQLLDFVKVEKVTSLMKSFENNMVLAAFDSAETDLNELIEIKRMFPESILEDLNASSLKIKQEKDKYIDFPFKINERNIVLYENKLGKITYLGEGIRKNELTAVFRYDGDLKYIADEISLNIRTIFDNGNNFEIDNWSRMDYRFLPEYTIVYIPLKQDSSRKIVRLDYKWGFENKEEMASIAMDSNNPKEVIVPGIIKLNPLTLQTKLLASDDEKTIEINKIETSSQSFTISGKVTTNKDIILDDRIYMHIPLHSESTYKKVKEELFAGIPKDFSYNFSFNKPLSNDVELVKLYLFNTLINFNPKTGEEATPAKEELIKSIVFSEGEYTESYNKNKQEYYQNSNGDIIINSALMSGNAGFFSYNDAPSINLTLNKRYSKITFNIGIEKQSSKTGYGNTHVSILTDDQIVKEFDLTAGTTPIDLNVKEINKIAIQAKQTKGEAGFQKILISDGYLYK
ncbi:MAG TPA: hypothetical protein GXX18_05950 [Bacillales bacterium]|nr:hypothetical protein [Bacillales bacterium]